MFFDAHCDSIQRVFEAQGCLEREGELHVSLPGIARAGVRAQVFALWAWSGRYPGREYETAMGMLERLLLACRAHPGAMRLATSSAELTEAFTVPAPCAVIAGLEGTDALDGQIGRIDDFYLRGLRLLTLAWADGPFAGSAFGHGRGLSAAGVELVARCEELGIAVDCSHLSDRGFSDLCSVAKRPFLASHSGSRSVCANPRNLTDEMIRELANRGGVFGINLGASFLSSEFARRSIAGRRSYLEALASPEAQDALAERREQLHRLPRPDLGLFAEHVRYAINLAGEDCVGIGGDLDGVLCMPQGLDGVGDYPRLAEAMLAVGLTPRQVEKVSWGNMLRFFQEVLP